MPRGWSLLSRHDAGLRNSRGLRWPCEGSGSAGKRPSRGTPALNSYENEMAESPHLCGPAPSKKSKVAGNLVRQ